MEEPKESPVSLGEQQKKQEQPSISVPVSLDNSDDAEQGNSNASTPLSSHEQQLKEQRALDTSNNDDANDKYEDGSFIFQD